jgi:hypothetical protein
MQATAAIQMRIGMTHPFHIRIWPVESRREGFGSDIGDEPIWNQTGDRSLLVRLIPADRWQWRATMPIILWLLGVPLVVVVALMLTHVI